MICVTVLRDLDIQSQVCCGSHPPHDSSTGRFCADRREAGNNPESHKLSGQVLVNALTVHVKYWEELFRFSGLPVPRRNSHRIRIYFIFLMISPPFIAKTTFSIFVISASGSPLTAMTSANFPGSMLPI